MGINLELRNLENHIIAALNNSKAPIEGKRIILQSALNKITTDADKITEQELMEYKKTLDENKEE